MFSKPGFYYDEVFKENYWFFIGWSRESFKSYCADEFGLDIDTNCNGKCMELQNGKKSMQIIWTAIKNRPDLVAHECFHAVQHTLENRDISLNGETAAYLLECLVRKSLNED